MDQRKVDITLKNGTKAALTPEEFRLIRGVWVQDEGPERRQPLAPGDEITWQCRSDAIGVGIAGFINLSSQKGPVEITWNLPWAEDFHCEVRVPKGLKKQIEEGEKESWHPVAEITVAEKSKKE